MRSAGTARSRTFTLPAPSTAHRGEPDPVRGPGEGLLGDGDLGFDRRGEQCADLQLLKADRSDPWQRKLSLRADVRKRGGMKSLLSAAFALTFAIPAFAGHIIVDSSDGKKTVIEPCPPVS